MQKHTQNYLNHFNYSIADFIPCEVCGGRSVDVHHVIPRSKFGSKTKDEQDHISNLIALCRKHHEDAHAEKISKEFLKTIINERQPR